MKKCRKCGTNLSNTGNCGCVIDIPVTTDQEDHLPIIGGTKFDTDKIDLSLNPAVAEEAMAEAFMVGEKKYDRYNYTKGLKVSKLVAAAKRHINAYFHKGEERCPVDGQKHLGAALACLAMILHLEQLGTLNDDRLKK